MVQSSLHSLQISEQRILFRGGMKFSFEEPFDATCLFVRSELHRAEYPIPIQPVPTFVSYGHVFLHNLYGLSYLLAIARCLVLAQYIYKRSTWVTIQTIASLSLLKAILHFVSLNISRDFNLGKFSSPLRLMLQKLA